VRTALFAIIAAGLLFAACKEKKPEHKRTTPVETINAFRRALEAGRMPADADDFFLDQNQKIAWKLRCKDRGCNRARFKILEVVREDEYAAKYMIDYTVYGNNNRRIMGGKNTPITFAFHNGAWYFDQIGVVHTIRVGAQIDAGTAPPKADGGASSGDAGAASAQ